MQGHTNLRSMIVSKPKCLFFCCIFIFDKPLSKGL